MRTKILSFKEAIEKLRTNKYRFGIFISRAENQRFRTTVMIKTINGKYKKTNAVYFSDILVTRYEDFIEGKGYYDVRFDNGNDNNN